MLLPKSMVWLFVTCVLLVIVSVLASPCPKRGISITPKTYKCGDLEAYSSVSWWYDWTFRAKGFAKAGCTDRNTTGYVPMISKEISLRWFVLIPGVEYVLTFNEPDKADQANLTVEEVVALWPSVEAKSEGLPLIGPGISGCENPKRCIDWYTEFFTACPSCRVDYIGAHAYTCDGQKLVNAMETIAKHFDKTVWLTEFACANSGYDGTSENQIEMLTEALPLLAASPYVERYAWFTNRRARNTTFLSDIVNLMDRQNPTLTDVGEFYDGHEYVH